MMRNTERYIHVFTLVDGGILKRRDWQWFLDKLWEEALPFKSFKQRQIKR
jgi:hypothetical protein